MDASVLLGWGLGLLGGVGLAILTAIRVRKGPDPWTAIDGALALITMLWVSTGASLFLIWWMTGEWTPSANPPILAALGGTALGATAGAVVVLSRARPRALGLGWPVPWGWVAMALGVVAPFLWLSASWVALLRALGLPVEEQQLLQVVRDGQDLPVLVASLVYGGLLAPFVEELLFRGFLIPPVQRRLGAWAGILSTAALFGLLHGGDPVAVPPLIVLGVILGWLRVRSGSLWPAIALHLANNALAIGVVWWA